MCYQRSCLFLILLIGVTHWINTKIVPTLELKKHEQVNSIFDESLQKIDYNELQNLHEIWKAFFVICLTWHVV